MLYPVAVTPRPRDPFEPSDPKTPAGRERASGASRHRLALAAVAAAVAIAVFAPDRASHLRSADRFHDFLHVPGLAFVAVMLLLAFPWSGHAGGVRRTWRFLAVFLATVAIGVLVELLQTLGGSRVSGGDILRDAGGAAAAMLLAASWGTGLGGRARWSLRLAAVLVVAAFTLSTIDALLEERLARRQFPVLAGFSRAEELERFEWSDSTPSWPEPSTRGSGVTVTLWPARYPGFALKYFPRDWRGYRDLVFAATNPSAEPLPITIRVDDLHHSHRYTDRFNARYVLSPGRNEVRVPLTAIELAPRGRRMDLSRVHEVRVFSANLREPREIVVESLRLE